MQPGDLVGERFEIERLAGSGGMSHVFQAHDRTSGEVVALKVLREEAAQDQVRFEREARVLVELTHPRIVRYVAHGVTPSGSAYLAMEWLEGEDLQSRLGRGPLSVEESVLVARRIAEALAAAHGQGILHRDLKPSNLFLVNRSLDEVKVLDFGIARIGGLATMTQTGTLIGTPGYIAPEQARGERELLPRVDVFSLGCVLYECLAGAPLFAGANVMALLAKILFSDAPRISALRPDVPASLAVLLARMLARDPAERPADGAAVVAALDAQSTSVARSEEPLSATGTAAAAAALTGSELRMLSVVLIGREQAFELAATMPAHTAHTMLSESPLRRVAEQYGGHFEMLPDDSIAVTLGGTAVATDRAAQAARCALRLRGLALSRPIALCTGKGESTGKLPFGDAIDRAANMIARLGSMDIAENPGRSSAAVAIDDVTAGLLDARFDVRADEEGHWLHGEHDVAEGARLLLGKPSPCVGREREIGMLEKILTACLDEPQAQAVLVTAPAGVGKSRLAHEFVRIVRRRSDPVEIWMARGDALRTSPAFGLLGQALRGACGIFDGEPNEQQQGKLGARVGRHVAHAEKKRVAEFLGEMMGIQFPDEDNPKLRAARKDARQMSQHVRTAWEDFLLAECAAHPVLLLLEDLHWADEATVQFADVALRRLHDRPLMVIALARPEVKEVFPKLWAGRGTQAIQLKELTRKASERLVRQVLGNAVGPETIERLVVQAAGHAFYLEEMIRAAAEKKGGALPATVVAMVQSRLEGLDSEARRILRAASIFGEVFWAGAVDALVGADGGIAKAGDPFEALAERELVQRRRDARFAGEVEYVFRHAILRDAAYAMLTDRDRAVGHRLAGQWLEGISGGDPRVLAESAEHAEQSGRELLAAADRDGAAGGFIQAALLRIRSGHFEAAVPAMIRGFELSDVTNRSATELVEWLGALSETIRRVRSAPGFEGILGRVLDRVDAAGILEERVRAHLAAAMALGALNSFEPAYAIFDRVREMVSGSEALTREVLVADMEISVRRGDFARAHRAVCDLGKLGAELDPRTLCVAAHVLATSGDCEGALFALSRAEALSDPSDRLAAAERYKQLSLVHLLANHLSAAVEACAQAVDLTRAAGLQFDLAANLHNLADVTHRSGDPARARGFIVESTEHAKAIGHERLVALNAMYLAFFDGLEGIPDASAHLAALICRAQELGYWWDVMEGRALSAALLKHRGERAAARQEFEEVLALAEKLGNRLIAGDARAALNSVRA